MKQGLLSVLLVLLFYSFALAESSVWKAQKGKTVIYLGGTCHLLRESDYPLPAEFEKAYKASDTVVFETDLGKLQDPETQQRFLTKGMYTDGSTIESHVSAKTYSELKAYCDANGIPLATFRQFKPSMLMVTLTLMELMKLGISQQGVDRFFYDLALKDGKRVGQLETVDQQIDYLVNMAEGNEDQFISFSLQEMKTAQEKFDSLADAWRKGDSAKLDELMIGDLKRRQPKLYKTLISDRNRNWMTTITRYADTPGKRFVLVGVGHLVGPDGIVDALKKKGFAVEKL